MMDFITRRHPARDTQIMKGIGREVSSRGLQQSSRGKAALSEVNDRNCVGEKKSACSECGLCVISPRKAKRK